MTTENLEKSPLVSELSKNYTPIQITYSNTTDEVKKVSAFEIVNRNQEGINVSISGNNIVSFDFLKKYFYDNPHLSSLIRIQSSKLFGIQAEKVIYLVSTTPMGNSMSIPAIIPIDVFSKNQFQTGILDAPYSFVLDGLSNDLEFDLCPNTTIIITVFFSHKCIDRTKESLSVLREMCIKKNNSECIGSVIIENTSDESKEVILFDREKYSEYINDENLKISNIFNLTDNFFDNKKSYFNSIRIFAKGSNILKQISKPIQFNSCNTYYPSKEVDGSQFMDGINDVNIVGEELSSENKMKVTVLPNTRVVYLFKKVKDLMPTTIDGSFVNIDIETNIDENKKVNILSYFGDDKGKNITHFIGKNKLSLNGDDFKFNMMRIQFNNREQIENPITIEVKDIENDITTSIITLYPICFVNENKFCSNIVEIPVGLNFSLKNSKILVELNKKGDGMNVILGNISIEHFSDNLLALDNSLIDFPIWIENETDEEKEVELVNDISSYKEFPDGIKCYLNDTTSYEMLLKKIESIGTNNHFNSLGISKIYSTNLNQLNQNINLVDYTNQESPSTRDIVTPNYIKANQFNITLLSVNLKAFDLIREVDVNHIESEIKKTKIVNNQKIIVKILPKTKYALICNLK